MRPQINTLINNYISQYYFIRDNEVYEMHSRRLILPLTLEEHLLLVFSLDEDLNYLITYKWLYFNGMKQIADYWNMFRPDSINTILCGTTENCSAVIFDTDLI